jgi:hypothetical protein
MEMEAIVIMVKEENVMPENWRSASEMRALVESFSNKIVCDLMNEAMKEIQEKAKNGATYCYITKNCAASVANAFMEILTALGYTVSKDWYHSYLFTIRW